MTDKPKHVHRYIEHREYALTLDTPREAIQAMPLIGHKLIRLWWECSCGQREQEPTR
jgi:hypothetical protein